MATELILKNISAAVDVAATQFVKSYELSEEIVYAHLLLYSILKDSEKVENIIHGWLDDYDDPTLGDYRSFCHWAYNLASLPMNNNKNIISVDGYLLTCISSKTSNKLDEKILYNCVSTFSILDFILCQKVVSADKNFIPNLLDALPPAKNELTKENREYAKLICERLTGDYIAEPRDINTIKNQLPIYNDCEEDHHLWLDLMDLLRD